MAKKHCTGTEKVKRALGEIRRVAGIIRSNARSMNYTSPSEADVLDRAVGKIEDEI